MKRAILALIAGGSLLGSGCAHRRGSFSPVDGSAVSPRGFEAAMYTIRTGQGDWGAINVKAWTKGIIKRDDVATEAKDVLSSVATRPGDLVHVGLFINNNSSGTVTFDYDRSTLDVRAGDVAVDTISPLRSGAEIRIRGLSDLKLNVYFDLPPNVKPGQVESYALQWALRSAGASYSQTTIFSRDKDNDRAYYPVPYDPLWPSYHYYDPFWGGYGYPRYRSGVSLGFGVGIVD